MQYPDSQLIQRVTQVNLYYFYEPYSNLPKPNQAYIKNNWISQRYKFVWPSAISVLPRSKEHLLIIFYHNFIAFNPISTN